MGKIAILYKSRYGSTKQYAEWIAEETGGTLFVLPKVRLADLQPFDTVIVGGSLYAGGMLGISFLKKNFRALSDKKLIIFSVGASFNTPKNIASIMRTNLTPAMAKKVSFFHLRGGFDYPAMKPLDRFAMWILIKVVSKTPESERDEETRGMIDTYGKKVSFLDRKTLEPLLNCVRA